jgi:uncharacterized protein (DUF1501 family)
MNAQDGLLGRRRFLGSLGAGAALLGLPRIAYAAAPTENRLVVVMLRGALDGLAAVPPYGDPRYAERRAGLALPMPGQPDGVLVLDHTFALNAALASIQPMWDAGELLIIPATAGGYRTRSHFDAQDLLEMGLVERHGAPTGWLNRALIDIQGTDIQGGDRQRRLGLAVGPSVPLMLRGGVAVASWEPPNLKAADPTLLAALTQMYAGDRLLGPALADGIKAQNLDDEVLGTGRMGPDGKPRFAQAGGYGPGAFRPMAEAAGDLLAASDGPRVAVIDMGGWDTHVGQGTVSGRLAQNLQGLGEGLAQLKTSLGSAWARTAVLVLTEFGRTVAPNGTNGTDHGTASVALLLGGAVKGGRIAGDWPGLDQLDENRDLRMATDLRAVAKGVLRDHLGVSPAHLDTAVFPDSAAVRPMGGMVRA